MIITSEAFIYIPEMIIQTSSVLFEVVCGKNIFFIFTLLQTYACFLRCLTHQRTCRRFPYLSMDDYNYVGLVLLLLSMLVAGSPCIETCAAIAEQVLYVFNTGPKPIGIVVVRYGSFGFRFPKAVGLLDLSMLGIRLGIIIYR